MGSRVERAVAPSSGHPGEGSKALIKHQEEFKARGSLCVRKCNRSPSNGDGAAPVPGLVPVRFPVAVRGARCHVRLPSEATVMQRSATHRGVRTQSLCRSRSSEEPQRPESAGGGREGPGRAPVWPPPRRTPGPRRWCSSVLSVVGSAVVVTAAGCFCALLYPVLKELRTERVRGPDGMEQRMLGFWSVLVLSVMVGCICCVFSWTLTYLDHRCAASVFTLRERSGMSLGCGLAVLNGLMGLLTVIWSLF
ncbi:ADP-ribosylation factor-like protein 6-interacting protein 6 [Antennarius striatus]|uniref:ADP-ribosylation factor-like protein 6-interacting protein 6 n=1 Tax=Antennarius striatus TaxID=241820 RepID=UPI0035AEE23D